MYKTYSKPVIGISKFISNFFNPLTSLIIFFIYFSSKNFSAATALQTFLPILVLIVSPIVIWIIWNVKNGNYSNLDVSNRNQRKSLYFFISGCIGVYLIYYYITTGTADVLMIFLMFLLLVLQFSNYFIKSSMHTAFNVFVAALFFSENPLLGIIWAVIAALVGITRVILGRHTAKEVITGAALAALVSFIYLYTNIQFQH
ncbi:MAG: phosphatase PAP2 family protein [Kaistella sp.]